MALVLSIFHGYPCHEPVSGGNLAVVSEGGAGDGWGLDGPLVMSDFHDERW